MKGLTFWTLLLIGTKIASLAAFGICDAIQAVTNQRAGEISLDDPISVATPFAGLFFFLTTIISGIVSLIWIYGATRNALAIRPGINVTPGWAVGWFFVPFANFYKPFQYLSEVWRVSAGPGTASRAGGLMGTWWTFNIAGNIITSLTSRFENEAIASGTVLDLAADAIGMFFLVGAAITFFQIVRTIHSNQLKTYSGANAAEVF
jgi:hypothetical protein